MQATRQTSVMSASKQPAQPADALLRPWLTYLLQAIRQGTTAGQPPPCLADGEGLISALAFHQLAPLLYWTLQAQPVALQPPTAVMQRLRAHYLKATVQALQRTEELRKILAALHTVGIRPTLYKGSALAYTVYPSPACRTMGDLDLWIGAEEIATAQAAIEGLGYCLKGKAERPFALRQQFDGEIQLVGPGHSQGLIELHWGVFAGQWLHRVATIDRKTIRQRCVATELFDTPIYLLAKEDAVIQVAVHFGINHQLSRYPLRSLLDIALLDQQNIDWAVVVARARHWRVATVISVVLDLLINVFGAAALSPELCAAAAELRATTNSRLFSHQWRNPALVFNQTKLSASHIRFFYLLSMIDRPTDALYLMTRTLWPENEWLVARYGRASSTVRLRHIKAAFQGTI